MRARRDLRRRRIPAPAHENQKGFRWSEDRGGTGDIQYDHPAELAPVCRLGGVRLLGAARTRMPPTGSTRARTATTPAGANFLFADGSVRFIKSSVSIKTYWAWDQGQRRGDLVRQLLTFLRPIPTAAERDLYLLLQSGPSLTKLKSYPLRAERPSVVAMARAVMRAAVAAEEARIRVRRGGEAGQGSGRGSPSAIGSRYPPQPLVGVPPPRGPAHIHAIGPLDRPQPEMQPRVTRRQVAATAEPRRDLTPAAGGHRDLGADAVAIGGDSLEGQGQEVAGGGNRLVVEQGQRVPWPTIRTSMRPSLSSRRRPTRGPDGGPATGPSPSETSRNGPTRRRAGAGPSSGRGTSG